MNKRKQGSENCGVEGIHAGARIAAELFKSTKMPANAVVTTAPEQGSMRHWLTGWAANVKR